MSRQPRDLVAVQVGHLERMSVGRRPDGLHHVPEVEPAGDERVVAQSRERREAGGVRGDARDEEQTRAREGAAAVSQQSLDDLAPALAEHRLARFRLVGRAATGGDAARELRVRGESADRAGQRLRIAGGDEERARFVAREARAQRVCPR